MPRCSQVIPPRDRRVQECRGARRAVSKRKFGNSDSGSTCAIGTATTFRIDTSLARWSSPSVSRVLTCSSTASVSPSDDATVLRPGLLTRPCLARSLETLCSLPLERCHKLAMKLSPQTFFFVIFTVSYPRVCPELEARRHAGRAITEPITLQEKTCFVSNDV